MIISEVLMKKKILLIITILLLATACSSSYLKKINLNTLNEKISNEESFVLYLTEEDEAGNTLRNTLLKVAKELDIQTFYLNTSDLDDEELENLKENFYFEDSNIIVFVKNGSEETVLARIDDPYISANDLQAELITQGFGETITNQN